jgi:hypothetical protein
MPKYEIGDSFLTSDNEIITIIRFKPNVIIFPYEVSGAGTDDKKDIMNDLLLDRCRKLNKIDKLLYI